MAERSHYTAVTIGGGDAEARQAQGPAVGSAGQDYQTLTSLRSPYLIRAQDNSALTLTKLFPAQGTAPGASVEVPWSSLGAYLLNNITAKVMLSMFPPGRAPMQLKPSRDASRDLTDMAREDPDQAGALMAALDLGLAKVENEFASCMEEDGDRAHLAVAIQKMLCGGQHGLKWHNDGTLSGISLDRHVVRRDPQGNVIRFVVQTPMAFETLEEDIKEACCKAGFAHDPTNPIQPAVDVYTSGALIGPNKWMVFQECYGCEVPGSRRVYNADALQYSFPAWLLLDSEDYGRSYVEDYLGDLQTYEGLEQTCAEGAAAIARFLQFVSPVGLTDKRAVEEASNGAVLSGRAEDVTTLTSDNKGGDLQIADARAEKIAARLARAFLVFGAQVRQAERVTTEEIVQVRRDLEEILGAVYGLQVITLQLPYVKRKSQFLQRDQRLPKLPDGSVKYSVIGGTAALGRHSELSALDEWIMGGVQVLGPEFIQESVNPRVYMDTRAALLNINRPGLIISEEKAQEKQQQAMMAQLAQQLGPAAINQAGSNLTANQVADTKAETELATKGPPAQQQGA